MKKRSAFYIDSKLLKQARQLAKKKGRSLSNYITCLLLAAIEKDRIVWDDSIFWDNDLKKFVKKK